MPKDNQNQQFQALSQDEVSEVAGGRWVTLSNTDLGAEAWGSGGTLMEYTLIRRYWID